MAKKPSIQNTSGDKEPLVESTCSMSFQTAPFEELCGCVSAPIYGQLERLWDKLEPWQQKHYAEMNIRRSKGNRMYDGDCEKCGATGLANHK
jgi:hypothetical protein